MWALVLGFLVIGVLIHGYRVVPRFRLRAFPQLPVGFMVGQIPALTQKPIFLRLHEWRQKYGRTFLIFVGSYPTIVTSDPEFIRSIGVRNFNSFHDRLNEIKPKFTSWDVVTKKKCQISRAQLLLACGRYWASLRAAVQPVFHSASLRSYSFVMREQTKRLMEEFVPIANTGQIVNMHHVTQRLALAIIAETVLGASIDTTKSYDHHKGGLPESFFAALQILFLDQAPLPLKTLAGRIFLSMPRFLKSYLLMAVFKYAPARLTRATEIVSSGVGILIENAVRQASKQGAKVTAVDSDWKWWPQELDDASEFQGRTPSDDSVIFKLIQATNRETGEGLHYYQISAQIRTILMAGYDTSASALAFAVHCLSHHPEAEERLLEEIDANADEDLTLDTLGKFPFALAVVNETLRLFPPGAIYNREATEDCEVAPGKLVPKNTLVVICAYSLHRDPELWPEPNAFKPERFLDKEQNAKRHPQALLPFGLGPRMCIGSKFAMEELQIAVISLYRQYTFRPAPGSKFDCPLKMDITLEPSEGINVSIHKRGA